MIAPTKQQTLEEHTSGVSGIAVTPDEQLLVTSLRTRGPAGAALAKIEQPIAISINARPVVASGFVTNTH